MDFTIHLTDDKNLTLHRQIYEEMRNAIFDGRLRPGTRVPSTRSMATMLGVSRATVTMAFDYLLAEGYLESHRGSGTYVSRKIPDEFTRTLSTSRRPNAEKSSPSRERALSHYGRTLDEHDWLGFPDSNPDIQFSFGRPDLDSFPMRIWSQLMARRCRARALDLLDCPTRAAGYQPLKEAIVEYLGKARAVIASPDQVIVVNGSQQAIDLVTRVLVDRNDMVAMENPGYIGAQKALSAQGARFFPLDVDEHGADPSKLKECFSAGGEERLKLIYLTPSHQYPRGCVLSLPRRLEFLSFASASGTILVEDDYDSEFRYGSKPIPALAGIERGDNVVYIGTFSKVLLPALRLGYLVVPRDMVDVFARAKWLSDRHSSLLQQQVLCDFITEGHLERHIRKMRTIYGGRRKFVVAKLQELFGDDVRILGENAGINVLFRIDLAGDNTNNAEKILARSRSAGVGIASTAQLYLENPPGGEFLLNYGGLSLERISEGLERFRYAVEDR